MAKKDKFVEELKAIRKDVKCGAVHSDIHVIKLIDLLLKESGAEPEPEPEPELEPSTTYQLS